MADKQTTPELIEYMVRQAANGEISFNLLAFTIDKLQEAEMQKNNVVNQQPQAIVQPSVTAEPQVSIFSRPDPRSQPQSAVSQTPGAQVIDNQQIQRERETFGRPSQGATSQPQQSIPANPNNPIIKHAVPPYDPSSFNGPRSQPQQQPAQTQGTASQPQQPVQPIQSQGAASQPQQPVQPAQTQGAASQPAQPVQPATTGPQVNAQALNSINPNDIRLQRFADMEPKRLQVLKKKIITNEQRLKIKLDNAAKVRKFIYTLVTILATIFCAHGVNGYLETFVAFCRGTLEGLATYAAASAIMGVGLMFIAYAKEKAFNKPKFEKFNFLRGLQNFMNAEDIRKKLDCTIESKGLIEAEEARRASL